MNRLLLLTLASVAFLATSARAADKPNVLFIVADDLGWADVSWHGGKFQTPVMDKLVKEGVELDRHYVQPVCTPTRTALLSGRWTGRFGPHALSPSNLRVFPPGYTTFAGAMKEAGYSTHIAGKWHLGSKPEWGPNHYGFDESYGSLNGAVDPWTHLYRKGAYERTWHRNGEIFDEEGNATELVAGQVVKWIEQAKKPWFVYVPFHAVHIPIDAPPQYKQLYADAKLHDDPKKNESLQRFGAFVTQMDSKIGDFVAALDRTGQRKNTLIVFTSDNGGKHSGGNPYVGNVPGTPALSSNLPLRGEKGQLYEGGIRVPAFVNWPGTLQPHRMSSYVHVADWMPTITKLVGWSPKADAPAFDGRDIWHLLADSQRVLEPRPIYIPLPAGQVVLHDGWKLIAFKNGKTELYRVAVDHSEKLDLSDRDPQRLKEMQSMLEALKKDDLTTLPADLKGKPG